jgi:hypothetical protein
MKSVRSKKSIVLHSRAMVITQSNDYATRIVISELNNTLLFYINSVCSVWVLRKNLHTYNT